MQDGKRIESLTVGAARNNITAQVVALLPILSEISPAKIPPVNTHPWYPKRENKKERHYFSGVKKVLCIVIIVYNYTNQIWYSTLEAPSYFPILIAPLWVKLARESTARDIVTDTCLLSRLSCPKCFAHSTINCTVACVFTSTQNAKTIS